MRTPHRLTRAAAILVVLVAVLAATAAPAAAFSFTIDVVGEGVIGTGSILFPAELGADATGVDLTLTATLFGNAVTFTEAHIQSIGWAGASPGDLVALVVANLALGVTVGAQTFVLSDDGGGVGSAICTDAASPFTACGGVEIALTPTSWTYTPGVAAVPEASTVLLLLAGLGLVLTRRAGRGRARAQA